MGNFFFGRFLQRKVIPFGCDHLFVGKLKKNGSTTSIPKQGQLMHVGKGLKLAQRSCEKPRNRNFHMVDLKLNQIEATDRNDKVLSTPSTGHATVHFPHSQPQPTAT